MKKERLRRQKRKWEARGRNRLFNFYRCLQPATDNNRAAAVHAHTHPREGLRGGNEGGWKQSDLGDHESDCASIRRRGGKAAGN